MAGIGGDLRALTWGLLSSAAFLACGQSDNTGGDRAGGGGGSGSGGSTSGGSNSGGNNSGGSSSGSGGAAGSMQTGGGAGISTGGTAGASSCPPSLPPSRSACSLPNLMCSYGQAICTCMVSLGQPGGTFWLCDDGGSGGTGGSGGSSSAPCGDCAEGELCIHQAGGPGPSRYTCANSPPCTVPLPGPCSCVMDQGACTYQEETTDAGIIEICVCDNGLE